MEICAYCRFFDFDDSSCDYCDCEVDQNADACGNYIYWADGFISADADI